MQDPVGWIDANEETRGLTGKQRAWLLGFLTHGNKTRAADEAGYSRGKPDADGSFPNLRRVGVMNYQRFYPLIQRWLAEHGLDDDAIKAKIAEGMNAKETKFFTHEGQVVEVREVEALGIQRQYVDMAAKVRGLYAPTEVKVTDEYLSSLIRRYIELVGTKAGGDRKGS